MAGPIAVLMLLWAQSAQEMRPFLGVSASVHDQSIVADGQEFPFGLRIDFVTPDSGAAAAGLQAGDVIVVIEGVDFGPPAAELSQRFVAAVGKRAVGDTLSITVVRSSVDRVATLDGRPVDDPAAWDNPDAIVATQPAGTRLELSVERVVRLLTVNAVLGVRPSQNPSLRRIPPNEAILPMVEHLAEEQIAERLIDECDARADYEALRARLAKLVETGDPFRLHRVAYVLREPFAAASIARNVADVPQDPRAALRHAAQQLDIDRQLAARPSLVTGLDAVEHARQIEDVVRVAHDAVERAFAALCDEERAFLDEALPDVASSFRDVVMVLSDPDATRQGRVRRFVEIAQRVDVGALIEAGDVLATLLDTDYLAGLRADLADAGTGIIQERKTPWGRIVLAGGGNSWHREPAVVRIDLGGDDRYTHATQTPLAVSIDLCGDDTYQATEDFNQGGARFGVSLLADLAGNDRYIAQEWSQAACVVGVGLLWDAAGDDVYRARDYSQASALCGVSLLLDDAGADRYAAPRYAQSLAMPGGFSVLRDHAGDDHYYCSGRDRTNYGTEGVFDAFGQGCGIGFRGLASGGIAVLRDDAGDDEYFGGNFAQGGGYYFGWGMLVDHAGNDRYLGCRYAQAWAAHQALGYLEDHAGDDVYDAWRGVGQSCSWDETVTVLLDHAGNDWYSGGGFALCPAHNNGVAVFVDYTGDDHYVRFGGVPRADGNDQVTSFALQLDYAGDDHYPKGENNDVVRHGNRHGYFGDFPDGVPATVEEVVERLNR